MTMLHHYCIFYKNNRFHFGWIKEIRKTKIVVVPGQGKEFACSPSRMEYIWKGEDTADEKKALDHIARKSGWAFEKSKTMELNIIHELCEAEHGYTIDELSENFLDDPDDGWMRVALYLSLKSDNILFQQRKNEFYKRSEDEIQTLLEKQKKQEEAEERLGLEKNWVESLLAGKTPEIEPEEREYWEQFLHRLTTFLIHFERSQEKDHFYSLFNCSIKEAEKVEHLILESLKYTEKPMSWGRLIVERTLADTEFSEEEHDEAKKILDRDVFNTPFLTETRDQRSLQTFTVDNAETKDFDDAISWQETDNGAYIRVHISDVASFIRKGDALFEAAGRRISSLYTIKGVYPMFPDELSEGKFSLIKNRDRGVLTFEFLIDQEENIIDSAIYRSVINVDANLTYSEVDDSISEHNPVWSRIWKFCETQIEKRQENGALDIERIEVKLDISDPENIKIKSVRENTAASLMIQELAIQSNHLAATCARENEIPCLYRNQPPYTVSKSVPEGEKPSLKDINIQPAKISTIPEGHSALGLDSYLQITSPIRRFLDLVNQGAIISGIGSRQSLYTQDELLEWGRRCDEIQREYIQAERKLLDHWKIKYLQQNQNDLYEAQVIRFTKTGKALVNITKLQLIVEAVIQESQINENIMVAIDSVNPGLNRVVIREVSDDGDQLSA